MTHPENRDASKDTRGGSGRVGGLSGSSTTGWGPSGMSGTGHGTLGEVWDRSRDPQGGPRWVGDPSTGSGWP